MKTMIELYDERPIENVMAADVFKPETVIYLCPEEIAKDRHAQNKIRNFLLKRNPELNVIFLESSKYYTEKIVLQLEKILDKYEECAIDITGGTDNMLFAAGMVSANRDIAVFTYSYTKNRFFNIKNAPFAEGVECTNLYTLNDYIEMAGGKTDDGRVNKESLNNHLQYVQPLFEIFLANRGKWSSIIAWMQKSSANCDLEVKDANYRQKGEKGQYILCPEDCLREFEKCGLISDLEIEEKISYKFLDSQVKFWLRDVGSALEIWTYKKAYDSGNFDECKCSVIVEWESDESHKSVYNEIDVMAVSNVTPYFISCKACKAETYALNELEILRNRFGGTGAVAMLITSETCSNAIKDRADALNIKIIDLNDIRREILCQKENGETDATLDG